MAIVAAIDRFENLASRAKNVLRVGAVSYLNTRPLVFGLRERLRQQFGPGAELCFDLPSRLADALSQGTLDVALIPTIEFLRGPGYRMVSDAIIGCRGPVWSVRLLSRVPISEIRTLALDEGSRTSQALVQVLLWEHYRLRPDLKPFPMSVSPEQVDADALLMIGDRAMHPPVGMYREIWDLGDRWCRWSELPFVFAVWAARPALGHDLGPSDWDALTGILQAARDEGQSHFEEIAEANAGLLGLTVADCVSYFAENLHFHFGSSERKGMQLFAQRAADIGLVSEISKTFKGVLQ